MNIFRHSNQAVKRHLPNAAHKSAGYDDYGGHEDQYYSDQQSSYDQSEYDQTGYDDSEYDQSGYEESGYENSSYDQSEYEQEEYNESEYYDYEGNDQYDYEEQQPVERSRSYYPRSGATYTTGPRNTLPTRGTFNTPLMLLIRCFNSDY